MKIISLPVNNIKTKYILFDQLITMIAEDIDSLIQLLQA